MAHRKGTGSKRFQRHSRVPEQYQSYEHCEDPVTPESKAERAWQLKRATAKVWECLDNATTALDLEKFWIARRADLTQYAIQVEFPEFIEQTWKIMRKLPDEAGVGIPEEPSVGKHGTFLEAYYNREKIPVDKVLLRNTVDTIIGWCRQVEKYDRGGNRGGRAEAAARNRAQKNVLRRKRRKIDPKTAERCAERNKQHKIDKTIFTDWLGESREDYQDYVDWKNQNLPEGWPKLTRLYVELAIGREKARLKRAGKWPRSRAQENPSGKASTVKRLQTPTLLVNAPDVWRGSKNVHQAIQGQGGRFGQEWHSCGRHFADRDSICKGSSMSATVLTPADASAKRFLNTKDCAVRYGVSWRHWLRLVDSGRAPQSTHFGRLVRWSLASLESWEAAGCPSVRKMKGAGR